MTNAEKFKKAMETLETDKPLDLIMMTFAKCLIVATGKVSNLEERKAIYEAFNDLWDAFSGAEEVQK